MRYLIDTNIFVYAVMILLHRLQDFSYGKNLYPQRQARYVLSDTKQRIAYMMIE